MTAQPGTPRDGSPFSNSTMGDPWIESWCGTCLKDKGNRTGEDPSGCPLLLFAYTGQTPAEWTRNEGAERLAAQYDCSWYEADPDEVPAGFRPGGPGERGHYVTITNGHATAFALGPYPNTPEGAARAEANVSRVREHCARVYRDHHTYVYGTALKESAPGRPLERGRLNDTLGLESA